MPRLITAALILTVLATAPAGAARRNGPFADGFDGTWSIEILTDAGPCDRAYRYPVRIEGGQARFVGTALAIQGGVMRNGTLKGSISAGGTTADVVGRLGIDGFGKGTWIAAGALACRGRWNAERRG